MTIARGAVTRHLEQAHWTSDYAWQVSCEKASITYPLSSSAAHQVINNTLQNTFQGYDILAF